MCGRRLCYHLICSVPPGISLCCGPRYRPGQRLCLHTPAVLDTRRWFPSPAAGGYLVTTDDIHDARTTIDREDDTDESAPIASPASIPLLQQGDKGFDHLASQTTHPICCKMAKMAACAPCVHHQPPSSQHNASLCTQEPRGRGDNRGQAREQW